MGVRFNATSRSPFPRERGTMPIAHAAGWAPGPFWMGAENLTPLGFDPKTAQPVASSYTDCALLVQAGKFIHNWNKRSMEYRERIMQGTQRVILEIKAQMGQLSPSEDADSRSGSHEIHSFLWNQNVYYCVQKIPSHDVILSQKSNLTSSLRYISLLSNHIRPFWPRSQQSTISPNTLHTHFIPLHVINLISRDEKLYHLWLKVLTIWVEKLWNKCGIKFRNSKYTVSVSLSKRINHIKHNGQYM